LIQATGISYLCGMPYGESIITFSPMPVGKAVVEVPVIYRQIGWMPCVACSDSRRLNKGQMWLGKNPNGTDLWTQCPECKGTGEVPRYQILDAVTGEEIDYEAYGRGEDGELIHHVPKTYAKEA